MQFYNENAAARLWYKENIVESLGTVAKQAQSETDFLSKLHNRSGKISAGLDGDLTREKVLQMPHMMSAFETAREGSNGSTNITTGNNPKGNEVPSAAAQLKDKLNGVSSNPSAPGGYNAPATKIPSQNQNILQN